MKLSSSSVQPFALEAGFSLAGVAAVPELDSETDREERERFEAWISAGAAGEMGYLKRRNEGGELVRSSLHAVFPWVKSVIVCAANYNTAVPHSTDPAPEGAGWISRYAWSETAANGDAPAHPSNYHKILLKRLENLNETLGQQLGPYESRCYVDTGPLVERVYARYAGIGWTGKNACILNQQMGSWFFLGVILTSLDVDPEHPSLPAADRCGTCTRCIDACPTGALTPYHMDATRCISYLTIEKRGSIPEELRAGMGRQVFGCDICQDVCPWNSKAPTIDDPEMSARAALVNPALDWLGAMSEEEFGRNFFGSPVKRAKYAGLRRNTAIAMGNSGLKRYIPQLREWSAGEDAALCEAAAWAIQRIEDSQRERNPTHTD